MTPEERFQKIENMLQTLTEHQVQHAEAIRKHDQAIQKHDEEMAELREMHTKLAMAVGETNKQVRAMAENIDRFLKGNRPNGH